MDLHLRYWDVNENLVRPRYYGSSILGHATHTDFLNHFKDITKELPLTNLFQIFLDGPNVNLKFFEESSANFNNNCSRSLIDMGKLENWRSCLGMGSQKNHESRIESPA